MTSNLFLKETEDTWTPVSLQETSTCTLKCNDGLEILFFSIDQSFLMGWNISGRNRSRKSPTGRKTPLFFYL